MLFSIELNAWSHCSTYFSVAVLFCSCVRVPSYPRICTFSFACFFCFSFLILMCLFFLVFCLFVILVRPVCFSCSSACCSSPSSSSFYFPRLFVTMFVFLVFCTCYSLLLPVHLCSPASFPLLFSAFFLFFVLCFLSPRSFCSSRSPSPFCSQEVRSISPFFRLAILDRLSYIYMWYYMVCIYIYDIWCNYICVVYIYIYCHSLPRKADPGGWHPAAFEGRGLESGAQGRCAPCRPGLLLSGRGGHGSFSMSPWVTYNGMIYGMI